MFIQYLQTTLKYLINNQVRTTDMQEHKKETHQHKPLFVMMICSSLQGKTKQGKKKKKMPDAGFACFILLYFFSSNY